MVLKAEADPIQVKQAARSKYDRSRKRGNKSVKHNTVQKSQYVISEIQMMNNFSGEVTEVPTPDERTLTRFHQLWMKQPRQSVSNVLSALVRENDLLTYEDNIEGEDLYVNANVDDRDGVQSVQYLFKVEFPENGGIELRNVRYEERETMLTFEWQVQSMEIQMYG